MEIRLIVWALLGAWLIAMRFQSLGVLKIGKRKLPFSYVGYLSVIIIVLFLVDLSLGFSADLLKVAYPLIFAHIIIFNTTYIFDKYTTYPWLNRLEHFEGGFILALVVWALLIELSFFSAIMGDLVRIAFLVGLVSFWGVVNEIIELGFDYFLETRNIGPNKWDTNLDLLMNTIGLSAFILLILLGLV